MLKKRVKIHLNQRGINQICIPKLFSEALKCESGDEFEITFKKDKLELRVIKKGVVKI